MVVNDCLMVGGWLMFCTLFSRGYWLIMMIETMFMLVNDSWPLGNCLQWSVTTVSDDG